MGYLSKKFQSWVGYKAKDPHNVGKMTTHELPIPDVGGDHYYIQFIAECHRDGSWSLLRKTNCTLNTCGFEKIDTALKNISEKTPFLYTLSRNRHYDIESIFTILDELESALLDYSPKNRTIIKAKELPNTHFSNVLKILPEDMQETIILRMEHSKAASDILKPRKINNNIILPGHKPPSN